MSDRKPSALSRVRERVAEGRVRVEPRRNDQPSSALRAPSPARGRRRSRKNRRGTMPEISSYKPGQFCWVELSTTDGKAAKAFYTSLFGWGVKEIPMGDEGTYTMFQLKNQTAAAMAEQGPDERKHGVPPHWNNYIAVKSA